MTFGLLYAFAENFVLPLSHDEVVYGKRSLIGKMPGDNWQRFANLRTYLGFMWGHPGKKLLFMGGEIAQEHEWSHDGELDWGALGDPLRLGVQRLVRDLNRLYAGERALHQRDAVSTGFRWVVGDDRQNSVFAFVRYGDEQAAPVLVVCNMTPVPRTGYRIGVPRAGRLGGAAQHRCRAVWRIRHGQWRHRRDRSGAKPRRGAVAGADAAAAGDAVPASGRLIGRTNAASA